MRHHKLVSIKTGLIQKGKTLRYKPPVYLFFSGGIDSTALIHFFLSQKYPVYLYHIDYGQLSKKNELKSVRRLSKFFGLHYQIIKIEGLGKIKGGEILGRNAAFVCVGLMKQKKITSGLLAMAIHNRSLYVDSTKIFMKLMQDILDLYTDGKVKFSCPFIDWYKEDIVLYCKKKKIPIHLTYSCELGLKQPCGRCNSCKDLLKLKLSTNGIFGKK
jgi:7-cyano-7-deazaguanine synthase